MTAPARRALPAARGTLIVMLLLIAAGCAARPEPAVAPVPSAWRDWPVARAEAERMAAAGRRDSADGVMADFVRRWPGTPEAEEGTYWRIVRQAERADDSTSTSLVIQRIDSVLAASPASARRAELATLRRLAAVTQQLRADRAAARGERDATQRARAEEIDRLRAELEEAKAELERVRKRVTRRRP